MTLCATLGEKTQPVPVNFLLSLQSYFKVNLRVGYWLIFTGFIVASNYRVGRLWDRG